MGEIRNRDIRLIENVRPLMQMIVSMEQRREWEKMRLGNITTHFSLTPGGGGSFRKMDDALIRIEELADSHAAKVAQYTRMVKKCEAMILDIPSMQGQSFVIMRYLDGKSDADVRAVLNMGRYQYENMKRAVEDAACLADVKWGK